MPTPTALPGPQSPMTNTGTFGDRLRLLFFGKCQKPLNRSYSSSVLSTISETDEFYVNAQTLEESNPSSPSKRRRRGSDNEYYFLPRIHIKGIHYSPHSIEAMPWEKDELEDVQELLHKGDHAVLLVIILLLTFPVLAVIRYCVLRDCRSSSSQTSCSHDGRLLGFLMVVVLPILLFLSILRHCQIEQQIKNRIEFLVEVFPGRLERIREEKMKQKQEGESSISDRGDALIV